MGMLLSIPMILVGAWMVWRGASEGPTGGPAAVPVQDNPAKISPGADEPA